MRLSEAIVLGSGLIKLEPALYLSNLRGGCGCLIGMGAKAIGKQQGDLVDAKTLEFHFSEYPWLLEKFPCPAKIGSGRLPAYVIISSMAWLVKEGTYTFEQALDWIRANEPAEIEEIKAPEIAPEVFDALKEQERRMESATGAAVRR